MSDTPYPLMPVGEPGLENEHEVGNPDCKVGWCSGRGWAYPHRHGGGCAGLVHAEFGDEDYGGDYWLWTKCDGCGESGPP